MTVHDGHAQPAKISKTIPRLFRKCLNLRNKKQVQQRRYLSPAAETFRHYVIAFSEFNS